MGKGTRRFSNWLAFLLAGLILGGCVSLEEKKREWIFRPSKAEWRGYSDNRVTFEERWIEVNGVRERLNAWWLPAASPDAPVLLYLHGALEPDGKRDAHSALATAGIFGAGDRLPRLRQE
jgi:hypothetical protein